MTGKSITKSLVWVLMGLLILGLGGFGVTNLSGNVHSVGTVGDAEIDINQYARTLRREIRALEAERGEPMSFAQAQAQGIDQIVLSQLVATAALDDETAKMGISVGDSVLRDQIVDIPGFQGIDGSFDRDSYRYALEQTGLTEAEFEKSIREETARTLVQAAVVSGVNTPASYTDAMVNFLAERRNITWAVLDRSKLATGLPVPTDEDLKAYHQTHLPDFTSPEIKQITFAWLTPSMIVDTVEVDEQALRDRYEEHAEEFSSDERRLVERLAFPDTESATAAKARIDQGESFDTLVEERGLELADVDLGDVSKADLEDAGDAVFATSVGNVVGPEQTSIGPALFRVNAILAAQQTTFEEARAELREELAADRARRVIDGQIEQVENLLAGGATIEDLARETDMEVGHIDWHPGMSDSISAYEAFRGAAAGIAPEDYPEVVQLDDGGIFAARLEKIIEPAVIPMEDVRDRVLQGWRNQATVTALRAQAEGQVAEIENGKSFQALQLTPLEVKGLTRGAFQADTPPEFVSTVFDMDKGDTAILEGSDRLFILQLNDILPPDEENADLAALRTTLNDQVAGSISQDLFQALANDIRARVGIELDQQALNAVHANFQ